MSCSVKPTFKFAGDSGVIEIEDKVGEFTIGKFTGGLVTPDNAAVISVFPIATPVAKPADETVATAVLELAQVTRGVISTTESSEYVPVAVNCLVAPIAKLIVAAGATEIEDNVAGGGDVSVEVDVDVEVDTDEQPTITKIKIVNDIVNRQYPINRVRSVFMIPSLLYSPLFIRRKSDCYK